MPYPAQMPGLESLASTFGDLNPETYQKARQVFDLSSAYNQQNLLDQRQEYEQNQAMNPLKIRQRELENTGLEGTNQATNLANAKAARENEINSGIPMDLERSYRVSKYAREMSDAELQQLNNDIQKRALNGDPTAQKQMLLYKDVIAEREKLKQQHTNRMEEIGSENASKERINASQLAAGRFAPRGGVNKDFESYLKTLKNPRDQYGALLQAARTASQGGDYESARALKERADSLEPLVKAMLQTQPKPGTANLDALEIGSNPSLEIDPDKAPSAAPKVQVPPNWKNNGDGTYTMPDGRVVRPKGK